MNPPPNPEVAVLNAALEIPPEDRPAYLDNACAGDADLRRRVDELLQAHERSGDFLEAPAAGLDPAKTVRVNVPLAEKPGDKIGRYKLLQQIGEGGCGVVYMAEQEEPVRRKVALKIIKLGMDTKNVIARFEAERQALALMDNPNIAKVLDAGATETGRPYFVMELVRGIKITDYCDENHLSTAARLELFIQICQAIQHAHQKGIIHRDIKPSNILVADHDGAPVPKVIDFGIAKATTDQRLTDKTLFTAFEQFIGTPAYMSPEQARLSGLDIDTRSDIYSLGVLLYELLTGKTPFEQKDLLAAGLDEMRRTIREKEPPKPSTRLSTMAAEALTTTASHRHTEAPKLVHLVRGDLDWIVMKALEKDRSRRYETAVGLARDIERHLRHEPVSARPPSRLYEFQKTVRRHRVGIAATAAVIIALAIGVVVSTLALVRAQRAEREQEHLRLEAEAGRAAEATLRQQAEAKERIIKARVLYDTGKYGQAEKLLNEIPASARQPDNSHATLRRLIGEEHAVRSEWKEAADNFSILMQVDALDTLYNQGLDFLRCGPALAELGDTNRYQQFVRAVMVRFGSTNGPITAERVCKICLLLPADQTVLAQLSGFFDVALRTQEDAHDGQAKGWACISLAMVEYRRGNYTNAVKWSSAPLDNRSLSFPTSAATALVIRSMSRHQLHDDVAARSDLAEGREMINSAFGNRFVVNPAKFDIFDWMFARILLREATALLQNESAEPAR